MIASGHLILPPLMTESLEDSDISKKTAPLINWGQATLSSTRLEYIDDDRAPAQFNSSEFEDDDAAMKKQAIHSEGDSILVPTNEDMGREAEFNDSRDEDKESP